MDIGQKIAHGTLREALLRIAAVPWYRMREQTVRVIIEKKKKTKRRNILKSEHGVPRTHALGGRVEHSINVKQLGKKTHGNHIVRRFARIVSLQQACTCLKED